MNATDTAGTAREVMTMDRTERTRLRALYAKIGALRFEEPDTVVSYDGGEVCALGFFVSTHAALIVGAVNALPTLLDALDAAEREHATDCDLIARQRDILTAVADALKGAPAALSSHSHHDLGEVARRVVSERDDLRAKAGDDHPWGQWAQAFQRERDEARRQRDAAEHEGDDARAEEMREAVKAEIHAAFHYNDPPGDVERPIAPRAGEWESHQTLRRLLSRVCVVLTEGGTS